MHATSSERTGIMVLSLWIDGDAKEGLRARITRTLDSSGHERTMDAAASREDICAVVAAWVDAFVDTDGRRVQFGEPASSP